MESSDDAQLKEYVIFFRWGRVGTNGMTRYVKFKHDSAAAVSEFQEKLEAKTVVGNYVELQMSYENESESEKKNREADENAENFDEIKTQKFDNKIEK